jgi:magnesium-transporting ATPase (P-type)
VIICLIAAGDHPVTARAIARSVNIMPGMTVDEVAANRGCSKESIIANEAEMEKVFILRIRRSVSSKSFL